MHRYPDRPVVKSAVAARQGEGSKDLSYMLFKHQHLHGRTGFGLSLQLIVDP